MNLDEVIDVIVKAESEGKNIVATAYRRSFTLWSYKGAD